MECYSCREISRLSFVINGRIDVPENNSVSICCRNQLGDIPTTTFTNNPKENLERFLGMRHLAMIRGFANDAKEQNFACAKCELFCKGNWNFSPHISSVNLSMYPSPCQCRCFYCHAAQSPPPEASKAYESLFDTLNLAKKLRLIVPQKTSWQVSCGEITIHPYKKQILDFTKGELVWFYTNGFVFDEDIAREIHDNPSSLINLSIDAGTSETWHKVKGVNNFRHVLDNLKAYRKVSQRSEQITLKYIICPGINDSEEDFRSFVDILKALDVRIVLFSRDCGAVKNFSSDDRFEPAIVESAARLLAICKFNGLAPIEMYEYTAHERRCIEVLANEILQYMR